MRATTLAFLLAALAAPLSAQRPIPTDGARLAVPGGEIWYRVTGSGSGTPVVLLHGGPGVTGAYLKSMEALGDERVVVRYDQLGAGLSDVVSDTALFTVARYVAELDSVRRFLGLERFHLYGHSWGATLAVEYYREHPRHVASLVLASDALDVPAFYRSMRARFEELPDSLLRAVEAHEAGQPFDSTSYRAALMQFNSRFASRRPVMADLDTMARTANQAISDHMIGTKLFEANGTMRAYDARPFLRRMNVPVLFLVGEFDFVGAENVREHAAITPGARLVVIPGAGHTPHWDDPAANVEAVRSFLRDVDGRAR